MGTEPAPSLVEGIWAGVSFEEELLVPRGLTDVRRGSANFQFLRFLSSDAHKSCLCNREFRKRDVVQTYRARPGTLPAPPVLHRCLPGCEDPASSESVNKARCPALFWARPSPCSQPVARRVPQVVKPKRCPSSICTPAYFAAGRRWSATNAEGERGRGLLPFRKENTKAVSFLWGEFVPRVLYK